jgi:hypothetical protein
MTSHLRLPEHLSTATPLSTAAGVTSTFTTGGTGGGTCTTPAGTATTATAFTPNTANQAVSLSSFLAGSSNFFQFQLSNVQGFQNYMLYFQTRRSSTGPANADIQYSTDGMTFTTFQSIAVPATTPFSAFNIDLSAVNAIENQPNVFFRILGRDGTGSTGTFVIDNFQVQAFGPTASFAAVSGTVSLPNTLLQGRIFVTLTDMQGNARTVTPVKGGIFRFRDVAAGETYILSVSVRGVNYAPQIITVTEDMNGITFEPVD